MTSVWRILKTCLRCTKDQQCSFRHNLKHVTTSQETGFYSMCISHCLLLSGNVKPLCESTDLVKWIKCKEALIIMFREMFLEVSIFIGYTFYICVARWHCSHKNNMIHSSAVIQNTHTQTRTQSHMHSNLNRQFFAPLKHTSYSKTT